MYQFRLDSYWESRIYFLKSVFSTEPQQSTVCIRTSLLFLRIYVKNRNATAVCFSYALPYFRGTYVSKPLYENISVRTRGICVSSLLYIVCNMGENLFLRCVFSLNTVLIRSPNFHDKVRQNRFGRKSVNLLNFILKKIFVPILSGPC